MTRPRLTLAGGDVELVARLPDGRAVAAYVGRDGTRTPFTATAWPHELRGIGWHLAEIKRAIAGLPLQGAAPIAPTQSALAADRACSGAKAREASHHLFPIPSEPHAPQPRGFLHAHHTAAED